MEQEKRKPLTLKLRHTSLNNKKSTVRWREEEARENNPVEILISTTDYWPWRIIDIGLSLFEH